jgi:hypothetical protein
MMCGALYLRAWPLSLAVGISHESDSFARAKLHGTFAAPNDVSAQKQGFGRHPSPRISSHHMLQQKKLIIKTRLQS